MRLAIVIPTLEEQDSIEEAISNARAAADLVIIADGGSKDATLEKARAAGCITVDSVPGRGTQIAAGVREATEHGATAVLILHADTRLQGEARGSLESALEAGAVGGGFSVTFGSPLWRFRVGERFVNLRSRWLRLPLGDQAQFATIDAIDSIGGFPELPILEDLRFIRKLASLGPLAVLSPPVVTSTRRLERGTVRVVLTNWSIWLLYLLGISPARLASMYRQVR